MDAGQAGEVIGRQFGFHLGGNGWLRFLAQIS
jgi:hypothetical protein